MSDEREHNNERDTVHDAQDREKRRALGELAASGEVPRVIELADLVLTLKDAERYVDALIAIVAQPWNSGPIHGRRDEEPYCPCCGFFRCFGHGVSCAWVIAARALGIA